MVQRRSGLLYVAAFFLIVGIGSFIMPLLGREISLFKLFGDYALVAKIACLAVGGVFLVIGLIRLFTGPKPSSQPEADQKQEDKKD
jgi:hypothetical protein